MVSLPIETPPDQPASGAVRDGAKRRIIFLGLRGIPNVQGGVEKHVEMLATELTARGWDCEVIGRSRYLTDDILPSWNGIRILPLWAPRRMALEAVVHTFFGVWLAAWRRPDILHIHAIGPALFAPLARCLGIKVVVTHHGYDYDREKWGGLARRVLKIGEYCGMRLSNGQIAVSNEVARTMAVRYDAAVAIIPNGVATPQDRAETGILDEFKLQSKRYILLAARFVAEKRQIDLIKAFAKVGIPGFKLVLAGNAEFETPYAREVSTLAENVPGVVLTGFQKGDRLAELFANAALFVLPSSHEGMPIALLEAMSFGLPVLASDIVANKDLALPDDDYFPLGDVDLLAQSIAAKLAKPLSDEASRAQRQRVEQSYSWQNVAEKTLQVYQSVLAK